MDGVRQLTPMLIAVLCVAHTARAAELEEVRALLGAGEYEKAQAQAAAGGGLQQNVEDWPLIEIEAALAKGNVAAARAVFQQALVRLPYALRLRLAGLDVLRQSGETEAAKALFAEIDGLAARRDWAYRQPPDMIALGRAALVAGADPKKVLETFYDPVKKTAPDFRGSYLATGDLALDKNDFALAGKVFAQAVKKFPGDADMQFGLARAFAPSDGEQTKDALTKTLELNPRHVGAHLLLAEHAIDGERYDAAATGIAEALKVNPSKPEAHALLAVLAHLRADATTEKSERSLALKGWADNPAVDSLIGRKLSQKYRFAEGAERQRQALKFDPDFLPAKMQLAQDLLRLGQDEEGWKLVEQVQQKDPYDVVAFNLTTLKDRLAKFETLTSDRFTLRMDPQEAAIYGRDALALLERAHALLTKKYGLELKQRTIVEIFPDQRDFAIRTFGLPGGGGYLGVCFGRLITANSPASRPDGTANWEAVLWHEFCHVVTLTLTKNKMPRWLSEGISVYEERQQRGAWGEQMKPRYRAMILGEDLTPVSQLSGAFLNPKTPAHLGFAYYESSLVVEYFVERFGADALRKILADLAKGVEINAAIAAHAAPIATVDAEFAARAKEIANNVAPKLDWAKPKPGDVANAAAIDQFLQKNPTNLTALTERARQLIRANDYAGAKVPLEKLIELYPNQHDSDSAYAMLAEVHRKLDETDAELAVLNKLAELSADASDAYSRLIVLARERKDWPAMQANAARLAAVNPLTPIPHIAEAEAAEALGQRPAAIAAYRTVLRLDPENPSDIHYRLARLLRDVGDAGAKREVLLALEESPRFRDALQLLLELSEKTPAK